MNRSSCLVRKISQCAWEISKFVGQREVGDGGAFVLLNSRLCNGSTLAFRYEQYLLERANFASGRDATEIGDFSRVRFAG